MNIQTIEIRFGLTGYKYLYISIYRPVSLGRARFPIEVFVCDNWEKSKYYDDGKPHSFILTKEPLPKELLKSLDLTLKSSMV